MKKIGLIAGSRDLPLLFSSEAKKKNPGLEIIAVGIKGETSKKISSLADKVYWIFPGELKKITEVLVKEGVGTAVLAGQVSPYRIFRGRKNWDELMLKVSANTPDFRPHSIFTEIIKEIEKCGINFVNSTTYLEEFIVSSGVNNSITLSDSLEKEIEHALSFARRIADLDIGQVSVFKNKSVVAVEALEGTDNTIKRAYKICGSDFIVVKLAKENQDLRFDVPVVGLKTIKLLGKYKAKALVLEKGKSLLLDKPEVLSLADKFKISIIGV